MVTAQCRRRSLIGTADSSAGKCVMQSIVIRRFVVAYALALGLLALSGPARAAVVIPLTVEDMADRADRIILGDVIEVTSGWNQDNTLIITTVTIDTHLTFKGDHDEFNHIEVVGGTVGDLSLSASDMAVFEPGDSVLLFVKPDETLVGSFQGAYYTDGIEVGRSDPGVHGVDDAHVMPLRDMIDEIARALRIDPPADEKLEVGGVLPSGDRFALIGADWSYQEEPMGEEYLINPNCDDASAGPIQNQITAIFLGSAAGTHARAEFALRVGEIRKAAWRGRVEVSAGAASFKKKKHIQHASLAL